jgi:hypothetical protein
MSQDKYLVRRHEEEALAYVETGRAKGKVVVRMN